MLEEQAWMPAPETLSLGRGNVQIWRVPLERPQLEVEALSRLLTPDEVARAARFRFASHRRRYIVTRGVLRKLLGKILDLSPANVRLHYGPEGKPHLAPVHGGDVQFNVAHSHEVALLALTRGAALGVDLEYMRELEDAPHLARRFFSPQEVMALMAMPVEQQKDTFFRIWTRKEAFIKATGKGLSQPLRAFNVMNSGGEPLDFVELDGATTSWRLRDIFPGATYGGALAVWAEHEPSALQQYHYG